MQNSSNDAVIRRRSVVSRRRRDGLLKFARNNTSQNGEDGIIERLFQLLPPSKEQQQQLRFCVDVGAWDGKHLSNTYSLLVNPDDGATKWQGLLIEQDEPRFQQLRELHEPLGNICLGVAVSGTEYSPNGLHLLLKKHAPLFPADFDFLSIDVDGADYWLLHDLWKSGTYQPKVVCVEFNPTIPDDLVYIPPRRDDIRHGASLSALVELAQGNGYQLVETTLFNAFFVENHLYEIFLSQEVPDTSIEALHEISMGTSLFQLYDGTIKLWGCKKMLWHRLPMDEEKMQIIPIEKRHFPFAPPPDHDASISQQAVDMKAYCLHDRSSAEKEKRSCAQNLWGQLKTNGFALVRGTGLSQLLCQAALDATKAFLQDADESVRRSCLTKDRARRGYSPRGTENFASLIGEHGPNDLVRKFRIGPINDHAGDNDKDGASSPLLRPNVWPTAESWNSEAAETFRKAIEAYYDAIHGAAHAVVSAICDGACHEQGSSLSILASRESVEHTSILTLLGYQISSRHKGKQERALVAAHTDVGVITMLLFDSGDCATLQRRGADVESWVDVCLPSIVPVDPVFVVNVGDCLSDLSNGLLPSTLHRVMSRRQGATPRNCLALFVGLDPDEMLTLSTGEMMTYEEWRKRRIARAQDVLRARVGGNK